MRLVRGTAGSEGAIARAAPRLRNRTDRTRIDTTHLTVQPAIFVQRTMSIAEDRFSGEPFRERDVQFDHPQIRIA